MLAVAFMPFVSFRNTNGGRMNLVGVGIDSGTTGPGSNTRGGLNFTGGWWICSSTRCGSGAIAARMLQPTPAAAGWQLTFQRGIVDVNTLIAGYQAYTNNSCAQGR